MSWSFIIAALIGGVVGALLPRSFLKNVGLKLSGAVALILVGCGVLTYPKASATVMDFSRWHNQYRVDRSIALTKFAATIKKDERVLAEVYIGCRDCTGNAAVLAALADRVRWSKDHGGAEDIRVTWVASEHADLSEVAAAARAYPWIQCVLLPESRQLELGLSPRGSVFSYANGEMWASVVESGYVGIDDDGRHRTTYDTHDGESASYAESRLKQFKQAAEGSIECDD